MRSYLLVPNGAPPPDPQRRVLVSNDASPSAGSLAARTVPSAYSTHLLPERLRRRVIHLLHRLTLDLLLDIRLLLLKLLLVVLLLFRLFLNVFRRTSGVAFFTLM